MTTPLLQSHRLSSPLDDPPSRFADVDPSGATKPIRNRTEWDQWFRELFATLDALKATTDSIIWKRTLEGWREARWHASVISADVPDELLPAEAS